MRAKENNDVAGLAIHSGSIRYVRLRAENGTFRAVRAERFALPGGADAAAQAVAGLRRDLRESTCPVVLGVPSVGVKIDLLRYPVMPLGEIRDSLMTDFDRVSPYPQEDSILDIACVNQGEKGSGMSVLAAISRRAPVDAVLTAAERAGISVLAVEPLNMAVFRAAGNQDTRDEAYMMAWLGPGELDMVLVHRENGIFYRSVPLNGTAGLPQIESYISETAAFVRSEFGDLDVRDLFVGGEMGVQPQVDGLKVHPMAMNLPPSRAGIDLSGFEAAAGLALRGMGGAPRIDLRPRDYAERERRRHSFTATHAAAMLLLSAFCVSNVCCAASALLRARGLLSEIGSLRQRSAELKSRMEPLSAEVERLNGQERRLSDTIEFLEGEMPSMEVMDAIEANAVPGTRLSGIRFTPAGGDEGRAYSVSAEALSGAGEDIVAMSEGLMNSGVFDSVEVPDSRRDEASGKVKFTLKMTAKPFALIKTQWGGAE